jgi:hypothetical protein
MFIVTNELSQNLVKSLGVHGHLIFSSPMPPSHTTIFNLDGMSYNQKPHSKLNFYPGVGSQNPLCIKMTSHCHPFILVYKLVWTLFISLSHGHKMDDIDGSIYNVVKIMMSYSCDVHNY